MLDPDEPGKRVFVADYIEVRDLAEIFEVKPFKVVARLLELRLFKHADECIDFSTAVMLGEKFGVIVERLL
ncbi:MAG TPA: hypothetical protein VHI52_02205 [Verrucomicrobiae bacterium]|nr:hypothetical protein [Verrucomicrobiae bacterium]